jgi:hypothetical protein
MPQNYAKLSFMNSDHKQVTCVCDTVHRLRIETPQLLGDRFCLRLQTDGKGQSNVVGRLDGGFVCRLSKCKGYLSEAPTTVGSHCRIPPDERHKYISETLCFFYRNILSKISTITKSKISFCAPILRRVLRIRIGFLIEFEVRLMEWNGQSQCIWWV